MYINSLKSVERLRPVSRLIPGFRNKLYLIPPLKEDLYE